jgi:hypothetical protein
VDELAYLADSEDEARRMRASDSLTDEDGNPPPVGHPVLLTDANNPASVRVADKDSIALAQMFGFSVGVWNSDESDILTIPVEDVLDELDLDAVPETFEDAVL